jgi:DNA-binding HxlR family transcriptional regulator
MNDMNTRRSTCPISSSLEILGDRWSLLIVRDMLFAGARTYKDFLASEEKIATNILASRLEKLQASGIITSERNPDDGRSFVYRLTGKGIDLVPVIMELSNWGTRYEDGKPPGGVLEAWQADPTAFQEQLRQSLGAS